MRAALRSRPTTVLYPAQLGADEFERTIKSAGIGSAHAEPCVFDHSALEFAPLEVLVSMLLLYNLLAQAGTDVEVHWASTQSTFRYAERMGFFEVLDERVKVQPSRPTSGWSTFNVYRNNNPQILELTAIDRADNKSANVTLARLRERLAENLNGSPKAADAVDRVWTCASETIGNIYEHSETVVPGIVTAQRYTSPKRGARLQLVIGDAGLGMTRTIRHGNPAGVGSRTDVEIIATAFRDGLSRYRDVGHGCGLTRCAQIAARYGGNLRVRTGRTWVKLVTRSQRMGWTVAIYDDKAARINGTQIVFDFYLDRVG